MPSYVPSDCLLTYYFVYCTFIESQPCQKIIKVARIEKVFSINYSLYLTFHTFMLNSIFLNTYILEIFNLKNQTWIIFKFSFERSIIIGFVFNIRRINLDLKQTSRKLRKEVQK
mgnify:CR=1 FL=1